MKKISILGLALLAVGSASAQMQAVKDAENKLKDVKTYPSAIEILKPAMTNPESANDALTWYVAGKGALAYVNNAMAMQKVTGEIDAAANAQYVLDGIEYLQKALPLDSVLDAKGKVKTKYSKDILKQIANNFPMLAEQAGAWFFNDVKDYPKAAEAWSLLETLPKNPELIKAGMQVLPDTVVGMYMFYSGTAYYQVQDFEKAVNSYLKAINLGYKEKNAFDYAIAAANQAKNFDQAAEIAKMAYEIYPDNNYLGNMINASLDKEDYDTAERLLEPFLAKDPNNAQVYYLKGVIADRKKLADEAEKYYKKAIELDPNNARAMLQYSFKLYQKAVDLDENEAGGLSNAAYKKFQEERTFPLYREAAANLEKALQIDENLTECITLLRSIYYQLGDEANLERVNQM